MKNAVSVLHVYDLELMKIQIIYFSILSVPDEGYS